MIDEATMLASLPGWAFALMLVVARTGAAMVMLPGLGETSAPTVARAGLAFGIALLVLPSVAPLVPSVPDPGIAAAGMVAAEVVTGLWLGWLARIIVLALPVAGQMTSYLLGLSNVLQPDAEIGGQATAVARLFDVAVPVLVLGSGLYVLPLAALSGSYTLVAPGTLLPSADTAATAVSAVAKAFTLALQLAAPFLLASVVWTVAIGLLARLVPRLQVYFLAMPAQIFGGLLLLALAIAGMLSAWQGAARGMLMSMPGIP
jgi:flagellar biosynthetic protein FliR